MKQALLMSHLLIICRLTDTMAGTCHFGCTNNVCNARGVCTNGCKQGYSGNKCDECLFCRDQLCSTSGRCSSACILGHYGARCDRQCSISCPLLKCKRVSGKCRTRTLSCKAGYSGFRCNQKCPKNCLRCREIHWYYTQCIACIQGYYGSICEFSCPIYCHHNSCDIVSGDCTYGCSDSYELSTVQAREDLQITHGSHCDTLCPSNQSICNQDCEDGYYGFNCLMKCPENCFPNACNRVTGECISGCTVGHRGPHCIERCPNHCNSCERYLNNTSPCVICDRGKYGPACDFSCPVYCSSNMCDKVSGHCDCYEGYHGVRCDKKCPNECVKCDRDYDNNNTCTVCKRGYYGPACQRSCSEHCRHGWCVKETGYCSEGCNRKKALKQKCSKCKYSIFSECVICPPQCVDNSCESKTNCPMCESGYTGMSCSSCAIGYYKNGTLCNKCPPSCASCTNSSSCNSCNIENAYGRYCQPCSDTCLDQKCEHRTGACTAGCTTEYYGEWCEKHCSETCLEKYGYMRCTRHSGVCVFGCQNGFYGLDCKYNCSVKCISKTCSRSTGDCIQDCDDGVRRTNCAEALNETWFSEIGKLAGVIGLIALVAIIIIVITIIICVFLRYKRNSNQGVERGQAGELNIENDNQSNEEMEDNDSEDKAGHVYMDIHELECFDIHDRHRHQQPSDATEDGVGQPHPCEAEESTYESIDLYIHASTDTTYESIV